MKERVAVAKPTSKRELGEEMVPFPELPQEIVRAIP